MLFMKRSVSLATLLWVSLVSGQAQAQGTTRAASVSGIVTDSLAKAPLARALIQLVFMDSLSAAARTADSDSLGRFVIRDVPVGRYLIGFIHPLLDSLGLELKPRAVVVDGPRAIRADLGIPSATTIRTGICGASPDADSNAVILGTVRYARDREPADSVHVLAQWSEITIGRGGMQRGVARREFTTPASGWFAVCDAPSGGTVTLSATKGRDTTEAIDVDVPATGFLRRDLYFGDARVAAGGAAPLGGDSLSVTTAPRLTGGGRLSGIVIALDGKRPLAGARVGIRNGPQTRTDAQGGWRLIGLPTGTRTLEVRALTYAPLSQPVDVVEGAAPVSVALTSLKTLLDTVRIVATRSGNRQLFDFMQRKRSSGAGRFITGEEIALRQPVFTSDLFRSLPGISIGRGQGGAEFIAMRGSTGGSCRATVFVNGMSMRDLDADDVNSMVRPNELIGVEVYRPGSAPAQFSDMSGCGSVLLWTR